MHDTGHLRERGASLVEAALVIPLLLILLATVVDMGRAYFTYITLINAAREGARYGVTHPNDTSAICAKVNAEAQDQTPPVTLSSCGTSGTEDISITTTGVQGTPIRVTVTYNLPVIMAGILGRSTIPISYSVAFRIR